MNIKIEKIEEPANYFSSSFSQEEVILDRIHVKIQGIKAKVENNKNNKERRFRRKYFAILLYCYSNYDLDRYTKSEYFNSWNEDIKRIIIALVKKSNPLCYSKRYSKLYSPLPLIPILSLSKEDQEKFEKVHSQIKQVVAQREILGYKLKKKLMDLVGKQFTFDDLIQYVKTDLFSPWDHKIKDSLYIKIKKISREFKKQNVKLSQNLEEYTSSSLQEILKRTIDSTDIKVEVQSRPRFSSYTEYQQRDMFNKLDRPKRKRVEKFVELEKKNIHPMITRSKKRKI